MSVLIVTRGGAEEDRRVSYITRLAPTRRRKPIEYLAATDWIVSQCSGIVGGHISRGNRVHVDPFGSPFIRQPFRQLRDPTLRRRVCSNQNSPFKREKPTDIQYFASPPPFNHMPLS